MSSIPAGDSSYYPAAYPESALDVLSALVVEKLVQNQIHFQFLNGFKWPRTSLGSTTIIPDRIYTQYGVYHLEQKEHGLVATLSREKETKKRSRRHIPSRLSRRKRQLPTFSNSVNVKTRDESVDINVGPNASNDNHSDNRKIVAVNKATAHGPLVQMGYQAWGPPSNSHTSTPSETESLPVPVSTSSPTTSTTKSSVQTQMRQQSIAIGGPDNVFLLSQSQNSHNGINIGTNTMFMSPNSLKTDSQLASSVSYMYRILYQRLYSQLSSQLSSQVSQELAAYMNRGNMIPPPALGGMGNMGNVFGRRYRRSTDSEDDDIAETSDSPAVPVISMLNADGSETLINGTYSENGVVQFKYQNGHLVEDTGNTEARINTITIHQTGSQTVIHSQNYPSATNEARAVSHMLIITYAVAGLCFILVVGLLYNRLQKGCPNENIDHPQAENTEPEVLLKVI